MPSFYTSPRSFVLSDALVSHGQVLLRAQLGRESLTNVDLIFFATEYLQLPTHLRGLSLQAVPGETTTCPALQWDKPTRQVFAVESEGQTLYVVAGWVRVFEKDLPFGQTSSGVLQHQGREYEIARSA